MDMFSGDESVNGRSLGRIVLEAKSGSSISQASPVGYHEGALHCLDHSDSTMSSSWVWLVSAITRISYYISSGIGISSGSRYGWDRRPGCGRWIASGSITTGSSARRWSGISRNVTWIHGSCVNSRWWWLGHGIVGRGVSCIREVGRRDWWCT